MISAVNNTPQGPVVGFSTLEVQNNCNLNSIGAAVLQNTNDTLWVDVISYHPDGNLYGINKITKNLYKVDLSVPNLEFIQHLPINFTPDNMTCGPDGMIYLSRINIYKYDIVSNTVTNLGPVGINGTPIQYTAATTFINGEMYACIKTYNYNGALVKVNQNNILYSTPVINFSLFQEAYSITTVNIDCDESLTYAILDSPANPNDKNIYLLNIENHTYSLVCLPDETVYQITNPTEYLHFDCQPNQFLQTISNYPPDTLLQVFTTLDLQNSCNAELVGSPVDQGSGNPVSISTFTYHPNGNLYGFNGATSKLYKVDYPNASLEFIQNVPLPHDDYKMSCSPSGIFYFTSTINYQYDMSTNTVLTLGQLGINGVPLLGSVTIFFVDGEMYASGIMFGFKGVVLKVNQNNLLYSTPVITSNNYNHITSVTTVNIDCDSSITYAVVTEASLSDGTALYELDIESQTLTPVCIPYEIYAITNPTEYLHFDCQPILDLDTTSFTGIQGHDHISDTICVKTSQVVFPFQTAHPFISTNTVVDSIWIGIADGNLDGAAESLACINTNTVSCQTLNGGILLRNFNQLANPALLQWVQQSVHYQNNAIDITEGIRRIAIVAYNHDYASDTVSLWLPLLPGPDAGLDTAITLCPNAAPVNLFGYLGTHANANGTWFLGNGQFNPKQDIPGNYHYIVSSANCPADTATVAVSLSTTTNLSLGDDVILCDGNSTTIQPNVVASAYTWQDGSTGPSFTANSMGVVWLDITDAAGCHWQDTVMVTTGALLQTNTFLQGCEGDFLIVNNQSFSTDTVVCNTLNGSNGCDSTVCFHLTFLPIAKDTIHATVCENETYPFNGNSYGQTGIYSATLPAASSCDSIVTLILTVQPLPDAGISGDSTICSGAFTTLTAVNQGNFSYFWSNGGNGPFTSVGAGDYMLTVTDGQGCTSTGYFLVEQALPISLQYDLFPPSCAGEMDGSISIVDIGGGVPPYMATLDGVVLSQPFNQDSLAAGNYHLQIIDTEGCESDTVIALTDTQELWLETEQNDTILQGSQSLVTISTNASGNYAISWEPSGSVTQLGNNTASLQPSATTIYTLTLQEESGCSVSKNLLITVLPNAMVYVPNAFSPNDDGVNDTLLAYPSEGIEVLEMKLFNRWGGMVKTVKNGEGWDGRTGTAIAPTGVYTYYLTYLDKSGMSHSMKGAVNLIS